MPGEDRTAQQCNLVPHSGQRPPQPGQRDHVESHSSPALPDLLCVKPVDQHAGGLQNLTGFLDQSRLSNSWEETQTPLGPVPGQSAPTLAGRSDRSGEETGLQVGFMNINFTVTLSAPG